MCVGWGVLVGVVKKESGKMYYFEDWVEFCWLEMDREGMYGW